MPEPYEFPDEVAKKAAENAAAKAVEEELKVEIVDDTPPEDRGRAPMPEKLVEEIENDDLEEYSEKVKKRLNQMKKVYHDERRAKEAIAREREEALRFAQAQFEENKALKQRLGAGEKIFVKEISAAHTNSVAAAREKYRQAVAEGDAEKIAAANEELTDAKLKLNDFSKFTPSIQENGEGVQQPQQTRAPAPVQVDRKAAAWQSKNTWFGQDEEMTALALGVHEKLVRSGVDPNSDDYYENVDKTMKKRFPDYFQEESKSSTQPEPKSEQRRSATIVAPASRSTAPRQIRLTASQAALAKRLGITPEAYAREQLKLEQNNG